MRVILIFLLVLAFSNTKSQIYTFQEPFAHTYSIVAIDTVTGDMAVGVQSHWFSVGSTVSWGEAGVGVVATQSFVNKSFGPRGLQLLKEGKTAQEALDILIESDIGKNVRQVAILDRQGNIAAFTGDDCIPYAGHHVGPNYSAQANMMLNDGVWNAMSKAFERFNGLPLPERVVRTLEAAQATGGDIRGSQSAALLVVSGDPDTPEWEDPKIDLRVDDSIDPIVELSRLLNVYRAYEHMNKGDLALEENNMTRALNEYNTAMEMYPKNIEMQYWTAVTLANNDRMDEAIPMFKTVFEANGNWKELTRRIAKGGLLAVDEGELKRILEK